MQLSGWVRGYPAGTHALVEWHWLQAIPGKSPAWKAGSAWHPEQYVGSPEKAPFIWHFVHATLACAPVSGKPDVEWLKVEGIQAVVV